MPYKIADGYNNTGGLTTISPQPATPGIMAGRISQALDRSVFEDGNQICEFHYTALTTAQYGSLLTQFGLTGTTRSNEVTVALRANDDRDFDNYNAIIQRLEDPKYEKGFWNDVVFTISITEAL